ncbi:ArdC-like ssDNA-binding domain-containing protein [Paenibacillus medicaginis]|uniref:ArdC-like ssDNA-binding domain-containing protein n=1 Tax=Paenibacillus medicaginis TaxID=1470560 RepID=A0ABV5BX42_9BACL
MNEIHEIYEIITGRIIEELKKGVRPWVKPWKPGFEAMNWVSGRAYRGINVFLTDPGGEYATLKQVKDAGGRVKPEEFKKLYGSGVLQGL